MQKFKKVAAVVLAMSMVFGSSVAVFATDSKTSDSSTGTGTNEGHLNRKIIDVELPSVAAGTTPFAYTVDLERLIKETDHAKYAGATFPSGDADTGVYFATKGAAGADTYEAVASPDVADIGSYYELKPTSTDIYTPATEYDSEAEYWTKNDDGEYEAVDESKAADIGKYYLKSTKTEDTYVQTKDTALDGSKTYYTKVAGTAATVYSNESEKLTVTSRSSVDVKVTVEVTATDGEKDVQLVDQAPTAEDKGNAKLYLALNLTGYNEEEKAEKTSKTVIEAGKTVSDNVTIKGQDDNFKAAVVNGKYEYKVVDDGPDKQEWGTAKFSLTGAASEASAEGLTAPELTVTWRFEDPNAEPAADDNAGTTDPDPEPEGPAITPGSASSTAGVDFDAEFTQGTNATYTFSGLEEDETLTAVQQSSALDGSYNTSANVTISGTSVNVAGAMWKAASSGDTRYLKVTSSKKTYVIKVAIK